MSREIKFRAWNKQEDKMVKLIMDVVIDDLPIGYIESSEAFQWKGVIYDIMQFTGLKDKNGVEIYEGDLLSFGHKLQNEPVVFENGCFSVFNEPLGWDFDSEEKPIVLLQCYNYGVVVGNIYENPELINN